MLVRAGNMFEEAARRHGDRAALADGTTYRVLAEEVGLVAGGLSSLGLGPGERVGALFHNVPELIALWLGVERAGLVRVVLHSHFDVGVHMDMLRRTGARALVFDARFAPALEPELRGKGEIDVLVAVGEDCPDWAMPYGELLARGGPEFEAPDVDEDAAVCVQPTTGTTGAPKPWVVSHRAWRTLVVHNLLHLDAIARFGEDEVNLHVHALQWASGAQTLLPYMLHGARTLLLDDAVFAPDAIADAIGEGHVTGVLLPGPMLAAVIDAIGARPRFVHSLRRVVTLFATPELLDRTTRVLGPVWCHGYGSTEQGAPVTRLLARERAGRSTTVGRVASPLIELSVLDADGSSLAAGRVGQIAVRSPISCGRYWDEPGLTEHAFTPGKWFRSGDLGVLDDDGYLTYVDRAGDAISTAGGVVFPHEIEAAVLRHRAVANCGAVGLGDSGAQEVVAAVVLKREDGAVAEDIARLAAAALPGNACPRVVIVEELPVVLGGAKVQRDVLRERLIAAAT